MLRVRNLLGHPIDGIANGDVGGVPNTAMMRKLVEAGELELIQELAPQRIAVSDDEGAELADLRARFDRAWADRAEQHRAEVDGLRAELDAARAEVSTLREQLAAATSAPKGGKAKKPTAEDTDAPTAPAKE